MLAGRTRTTHVGSLLLPSSPIQARTLVIELSRQRCLNPVTGEAQFSWAVLAIRNVPLLRHRQNVARTLSEAGENRAWGPWLCQTWQTVQAFRPTRTAEGERRSTQQRRRGGPRANKRPLLVEPERRSRGRVTQWRIDGDVNASLGPRPCVAATTAERLPPWLSRQELSSALCHLPGPG